MLPPGKGWHNGPGDTSIPQAICPIEVTCICLVWRYFQDAINANGWYESVGRTRLRWEYKTSLLKGNKLPAVEAGGLKRRGDIVVNNAPMKKTG